MDKATLFLRYYYDLVVRQSLYFIFGLPKTSVELLINSALNNVLARGSMLLFIMVHFYVSTGYDKESETILLWDI